MIIFDKNVSAYFEDLIYDLYARQYFGSIISTENYIDKIIDFIKTDIVSFPSKTSPLELRHLGELYIFYSPNKGTTWFIFYFQKNNNYIISGIINNHMKASKWLNK